MWETAETAIKNLGVEALAGSSLTLKNLGVEALAGSGLALH